MRYSITKTSVFAFVCGVFVAIPAARAATITVTSDSGGTGGPDCTLRDAITAANTDAPTGGCPAGNGADTIELPADATITLRQVDNDTNGLNGLPSVISEININGSGAAIQRDDIAPEFRIFHIGASGTLMLSGLSVSNGYAAGEHHTGGGIYNQPGGMLTMTNCIVSRNKALLGGGIYDWGVTTLTNCTISENTALSGGGILSVGELLTLIDCTVSDNLGSGVESAHGPDGLTTMIISNCTVSGNTTSSRGGGIVNSGILDLSNSNVDGNTADRGGGIANHWIMTMTDSTVSGNTADASGGVGQGGGIYNSVHGQPAVLIVINSNVIGNSAGEFRSGGGIYSDGEVTLIDSNVNGNSARSGSGIYNFQGMVTMTNSSVNWNSATFGGGIHNYQGTVTMSNSSVNWNSASFQGGGIHNFQGMVTMTNSSVNWNSASDGGGIYNYQGAGTLTLTDSTVSENTASGGGGGIRNGSDVTLTLTNSNVSRNTAGGAGGGMFNSGTLTLIAGNVSWNSAGSNGGGIFNTGAGTATLTDSIVSRNSADFPGGGIWIGVFFIKVTLTDSTICANTPDQIDGDYTDGGGNLIEDECPPCVSADFNGDGIVEAADLAELLGDWGPCPELPELCPADLMGTGDGFVDADDLAFLLGTWGPCP